MMVFPPELQYFGLEVFLHLKHGYTLLNLLETLPS